MHGWPCGEYAGENWVFEFTAPDETVTAHFIQYDAYGSWSGITTTNYFLMSLIAVCSRICGMHMILAF